MRLVYFRFQNEVPHFMRGCRSPVRNYLRRGGRARGSETAGIKAHTQQVSG